MSALAEDEALCASDGPTSFVRDRLRTVSAPARKLFDVIVRQAYQGPLHPKPKDTATPPEILEACGLDVGEFYALLSVLTEAGLIQVANAYPFEEIRLSAEAAAELRLSLQGGEGSGGAH
jgi:hypothetical protein